MTATATRRTTDHSSDDRAEGGLPTTSAHPRPSSPLAGASEPARRSQPTPSPPAGGHTNVPSTPATPTPAPHRARATVNGPGQRVRGFLRLRGAAHHRSRDTSRPAAAGRARRRPAELDSDSGSATRQRRRRWRPQPAVARHPLDGPHCAPPLRDTARLTLRRCWGQYWPIRSTGAFRCVPAPRPPLSNRGPASKLGDASTAFTTPSRTLRGTASQRRHKPRHDRREPLSDTGRAGQRDDSSGTSGTVNGDEDGGRPQPPILASSRPRPATADCNIVATALGVTSSERTPQTRDASPTKVEAPSGTPVSPRRLLHR